MNDYINYTMVNFPKPQVVTRMIGNTRMIGKLGLQNFEVHFHLCNCSAQCCNYYVMLNSNPTLPNPFSLTYWEKFIEITYEKWPISTYYFINIIFANDQGKKYSWLLDINQIVVTNHVSDNKANTEENPWLCGFDAKFTDILH